MWDTKKVWHLSKVRYLKVFYCLTSIGITHKVIHIDRFLLASKTNSINLYHGNLSGCLTHKIFLSSSEKIAPSPKVEKPEIKRFFGYR